MSDRIEGRLHAVIREGDAPSNRAVGPWVALVLAVVAFVLMCQLLPWGA